MVNQELTNYIQQSLTAGVKKEDIINTLVNIGWQRIDIDEAFRQLEGAGSLYRFQPHVPTMAATIKAGKRGVALKIFLLFMIFGLIGGGSWAYFFFIIRPQSALRQMPDRMAEVKNLRYDFISGAGSQNGVYKQESKDYLDKIIEKFKSHKRDLASIESIAKQETLNGVIFYHYNLALDDVAVEWLAQTVYETETEKDYTEFTQKEKEDLEKIIENIREAAPKVQKIDAYIGKSDLHIYKVDLIYSGKNISLKLSNFDNAKPSELQKAKSIREIYNDFIKF